MATEAKGVREDDRRRERTRLISDDIDGDGGIHVLEADGWRDDGLIDRHDGGDCFDRAGSSEAVASDALGRSDRGRGWPEDRHDRLGLREIVEWRRGPMGIDVANIAGQQSSVL